MRTINLSGQPTLPPGTFLMHPEHNTLLSNSSQRLTTSYRRWLNIRLGLALIWLVVLLICASAANQWLQLAVRGRDAQGQVSYRSISHYTGNATYYLAYEYDEPSSIGLVHVRKPEDVPPEIYDQNPIGTQIRVRYLADLPGASTILWDPRPPYAPLLGLGLSMLSLTLLVARALRQFRELWQLQSEGWVLTGRVLESSLTPTPLGPYLRVAYEFTTPDQQRLRGWSTAIRKDLLATPPAPESPTAVIYVSPNVYQML